MDKNIEKLEEKWGSFRKVSHYYEQCELPFISDQARLNVIFDPIDFGVVEGVFANKLKSELLPDLKEFYLKYNGCRLFSNSFNIYGVQVYDSDIYQPYDIVIENVNNYAKMSDREKKRCNLLFFGSLGGDYIFGYDRDEKKQIYCVEAGHGKILKRFDSFNAFITYYINGLINEYDLKGKKLHPEEDSVGIPVLENLTSSLF